jgi:hypothetical protein
MGIYELIENEWKLIMEANFKNSTKSDTRLVGCHAFTQMVDHHFQLVRSAHHLFL